jgi:hypothetical protein
VPGERRAPVIADSAEYPVLGVRRAGHRRSREPLLRRLAVGRFLPQAPSAHSTIVVDGVRSGRTPPDRSDGNAAAAFACASGNSTEDVDFLDAEHDGLRVRCHNRCSTRRRSSLHQARRRSSGHAGVHG